MTAKQQTMPGVYVNGSGPAIVLLHSSLSSAKQWLPLVGMLKNTFTLINIDILGYGKAPKVADPTNYNFDVEIDRINLAIKQLIGEQSFHLVGHSCGGAIALKLAVQAPEKLLSLSLFEPVAFHLFEQGSENRQLADSFADNVANKDNVAAAIAFTDFWNQAGFFNALPEKMQQLMAADMPKVNLDFIGLISEQYLLNDLAAINCPSVIMTGEYSPALSRDLAKMIANDLPNAKEKSFKAGHMAPISHAQDVQTYIGEFLSSL
ncbi:alpha/beta fold hydrolase [Thalassotalea sp. PLHSN55]|uniref:alpha/beta fold hydrolase n=1 Tax=Thalassotalea sp. PLHSN55 TaxID=3435888 RepID=UPI003F853122